MKSGLICEIIQGGINHFIDTGEYRKCYKFYSESFNVRTGLRKLREGINTGYIMGRDKEKLFYYELTEEKNTCIVYPVKNNLKDSKGFRVDIRLLLAD